MSRTCTLDVSVVIPVYNQAKSLRMVLNFFSAQTYDTDKFEIVVVDDGSIDELESLIQQDDWLPTRKINIKYVRQTNQGRAVARNTGAAHAVGERLIFCDADRIPDPDFVNLHLATSERRPRAVTIGCPMDFFGNVNRLETTQGQDVWDMIRKYARSPLYFNKIMKLYDEEHRTDSGIAWASFLVGNSSVGNKEFHEAGGFDPDFIEWGFEHFELAFRLQGLGATFLINPLCRSYHIPHPRGSGYYMNMIQNSIQLLMNKHPQFSFEYLSKYLFGEVSLQEFELQFSGKQSFSLINEQPIMFASSL